MKLTPAKTSRPPRRQARLSAQSRIDAYFPGTAKSRPYPAAYNGYSLADLAQAMKSFYKTAMDREPFMRLCRVQPADGSLASVPAPFAFALPRSRRRG
jgi:hypothetical protein